MITRAQARNFEHYLDRARGILAFVSEKDTLQVLTAHGVSPEIAFFAVKGARVLDGKKKTKEEREKGCHTHLRDK